MRKLILDKTAIKQNLTIVKKQAADAVIYGVLSGDGGGGGAVALAHILRDEGIARFALREPSEAQALRDAGFIDEELLMLSSFTDRETLEQLVDLNVIFTVSSVDTGLSLNAVAENRSTVVEAHIQVDTGMGFGGFLVSEPEKILLCYRSLPNVALSGIYTQILSAPKYQHAQDQIDNFQAVIAEIQQAGFETGTIHAAGSYAILNYDFARLNAIRAGSIMLGRCRGASNTELRLVGYGEAELCNCRWLPKGHTVGAGKTAALKRPTRVAVIPVGYQNGFGLERPRDMGLGSQFSRWWQGKHQFVRIGGQKAKIIGQIGAEEIIVDITNLKCSTGDIATFSIDPMFAQGFIREYR